MPVKPIDHIFQGVHDLESFVRSFDDELRQTLRREQLTNEVQKAEKSVTVTEARATRLWSCAASPQRSKASRALCLR